jgi:HTH-type transcriptional regulator/antitoxin HigA
MIEQSKLYPYSEMAGWGWVPQTKNPLKKVQNLLKFFGVTNFENIVEETKLQGAFRISEKHKYSLPAIVSWVRKGSVDAESIQVEDFDEAKVKDALPVLRSMTNNDEPNKLIPEIQELLRKCGIAFVVTPSIKNAPISGVTRWVTPNKALIHMSLRWGWSDIFWFSLFHEIGHILLDNKKDFNIDLVNKTIDGVQEHEKDVFAANTLIPQEKYAAFASKFSTSQNQYELIKTFARGVNVHPGIVVGRLQHDGRLAPNMNGLRVRFAWKKNKKQGI